jgi:hypothetical protein
MTRQSADDVKKEIEEQEEEFYGGDSGGDTVDVDEKMKDAFGDDVQEKIDKHEPFTISKEVEDDEKKRRGI